MAVRRATVAWAAALMMACGLLALPLVAYAATSSVDIQGFAYVPTPITIRVGDTVTWTNRDSAQHSARFAGMGTAILSMGQRGSLTFTTAGTFNYDCAVHGASMQGTVVVQAATPAPTQPPPPPPTLPPTAPPTAPPTQVRTAPPTTAPTVAPTAAPTEPPTVAPTTAAPSATASATPSVGEALPQSASPSAVAAQLTPAPIPGSGPGPLIFGAAALAAVALGGIAFFLMRRS
jgi:plastocyanin